MAGEEKGVIRIVTGKYTETADSITWNATKGDITFASVDTIELYGEQGGVVFGEYEPPPKKDLKSNYFVRGWWSFDSKGEKIIRRAVPGMTVYFHLETKNIPNGEAVYMRLFDEDNRESEEPENADGSKDKDDYIKLARTATGKVSIYEEVKNNKVVKAIVLKNISNFLDNETDRLLELYFRCSYQKEHKQYPKSREDYLKVGQLVIDRYKMPGLNGEGTDIADDMAYGTGHKYNGTIYDNGVISNYKAAYTENGFNEEKHALFSNSEDFPGQPLVEKEQSPAAEDPHRQQADHTRVDRPDPVDIVNAGIQNANKNRKAKYSKEECYSTKYKVEVPYLKKIIPWISTGLDVQVFDNFSDETLFWDFKHTASLYFAQGELQENLYRMIEKFQRNEGGIYEDAVLTKHIVANHNTDSYCRNLEDYIAEKLKNQYNKLEEVEDKEPYLGKNTDELNKKREVKEKNFSKPIYNDDKLGGLTIALNDIWATEVYLSHLETDGDNYTAKYKVTLWDHFGLDKPDMEKIFNIIPSVGEAFVCWFILQHLRGYKPFITKITFEREFKGNFNEGKAERESKRAEEERRKTQEWIEEEKRKMWREPKF